jgi:hypothetical protein
MVLFGILVAFCATNGGGFFLILKGFIALIRAGHTCSVTKLFLNTTNSQ